MGSDSQELLSKTEANSLSIYMYMSCCILPVSHGQLTCKALAV